MSPDHRCLPHQKGQLPGCQCVIQFHLHLNFVHFHHLFHHLLHHLLSLLAWQLFCAQLGIWLATNLSCDYQVGLKLSLSVFYSNVQTYFPLPQIPLRWCQLKEPNTFAGQFLVTVRWVQMVISLLIQLTFIGCSSCFLMLHLPLSHIGIYIDRESH